MSEIQPTQGITVPAREIPFPGGVSPKARENLLALEQAKSHFTWDRAQKPALSDKPGWDAVIRATNEMLLQFPLYAVAERPGIRSESQRMGGVQVHVATPEKLSPWAEGRAYLELHGSGMVYAAGEPCRRGGLREAERTGVKTFSVDHRMAPEHPYPAALNDCLAVYKELLGSYKSSDIIVGGASGGANLAAAMVLKLREAGLPLPAGVILQTPATDLSQTGDTWETLAGIDPVVINKSLLQPELALYVGNASTADPFVSPVRADFSLGFPPTFLQSGTRDMLLSDTVRMHRALRKAGIHAELHVWEGMPHGGFLGGAPEDEEISQEMRNFMSARWNVR